MKYTEKLNLKKPDLEDYVKISDLNDNMDILDETVGSMNDDLESHKAEDVKDAHGGINREGDSFEGTYRINNRMTIVSPSLYSNTNELGILIKTKIPKGSADIPTIQLLGGTYKPRKNINLLIGGYVAADGFQQSGATSMSTYEPEIKVAYLDSFLIIFLPPMEDLTRLSLTAIIFGDVLPHNLNMYTGWTMENSPLPESSENIRIVPYI